MVDEGRRRPAPPRAASRPPGEYWVGVYQECYDQVRGYFARRVKCPDDVEDLVQEVFVNLIAHNASLQDPPVYVRAVARHQLSLYWRQKSRSQFMERLASICGGGLVANAADWDPASDPLEQLSYRETRQIVDSMIACLSPVLAEALRLRFIEGLPLDEAAARAGCSCDTLKKRLKRAKRSLAELCEEIEGVRIANG